MSQNWRHSPRAACPPASVPAGPTEYVPVLYTAIRRMVRPTLRRFFHFRVSGLEHLPETGPFLVAANHTNYLDGVVLAAALPRKIVFLVMPRVYRATPLHPYFHDHIGSIPVNLARPDPGAIRAGLRVLDEGGVLGIFPEGPFSRNGELVPGQPGIALVALRAGVPVVPAAISGTFQALLDRRFYIPRRVPLSVRFGRALRFARPDRHGATQRLRADVTRRIMDEIATLVSDERTGAPGPR